MSLTAGTADPRQGRWLVLSRVVTTILVLLILVALSHFWAIATHGLPAFDGALNLLISKSLLDGDGYGSFYNTFRPFPGEVQSNGPFLFLAAASMKVFGLTPAGTQMANLAFVVVLAILVYLLLVRMAPPVLALLGVLLVLQAPGVLRFGMNGFGEIPALSFYLAALLAFAVGIERLNPSYSVLGGALLGLSFITKTVSALMVLPALVAVVVFTPRSIRLWTVTLTLLGLTISLASWETYRMYGMRTMRSYVQFWQGYWQAILLQSGAPTDAAGLRAMLETGVRHLGLLAQQVELPYWAIGALLIGVAGSGVAIVRRELREPAARFIFSCLVLSAALWLLWWLCLTPTQWAWLRRILIGFILAQMVLLVSASRLIARGGRWRTAGGLVLAAVLAVLFARHQVVSQGVGRGWVPSADLELIEVVRSLPEDAVVFGWGWWRAPVVSLFADRPIYNLDRWRRQQVNERGAPNYIVFDFWTMAAGQSILRYLEINCQCEPIWAGPGGRVYRIHYLRAGDDRRPPFMHLVRHSDDAFLSGFQPPDRRSRRAAPDAEMAVNLLGVSYLMLEYAVRDLQMYDVDGERLTLELSWGGCRIASAEPRSGRNVLVAAVNCPDTADPAAPLRFRLNGRRRSETEVDEAAWLFETMQLSKVDARFVSGG